ncbi:MAG: PRC-barrel domain-containing protein [Nocardiopsaceae bacterium]|jgi:sporulation protein YlmC with PRC-barrel domain|nr:PRC-barrel domain-containing protein [Nocardiopsaceae bacterium]
MAQEVSFTIGAQASCEDGPCGTVRRVVVDPLARTVTHLVVEPKHRLGLARLVPVGIAQSTKDGVRLRCSTADFEQFDSAEETQFVPGTIGYDKYGSEQVLAWPYYGLQGGPAAGVAGAAVPGVSETVTYDTVPEGEVDVRRGEPVYATDGPIGRVQGLVIDQDSRRVSHVLLAEGHLWGHKEVSIPISAVTGVEDGIKLRLSKKEVSDLPPVAVDR